MYYLNTFLVSLRRKHTLPARDCVSVVDISVITFGASFDSVVGCSVVSSVASVIDGFPVSPSVVSDVAAVELARSVDSAVTSVKR